MRYLPILEELFQSDTAIFLLVGLVFGTVMGTNRKISGKRRVGAGISLSLYALCEVIVNLHGSYLREILALFVGTAALGCFLGFLGCMIFARVRGSVE